MSVFRFQSTRAEDSLTSELQQLRDQVNQKRSTMNDHVSHLDSLRDEVALKYVFCGRQLSDAHPHQSAFLCPPETFALICTPPLQFQINIMTDRKMDLERRINMLQGEREGLSSTLDESADRIIMLEKQSREQDSLVS
jgi:coiled-coil domain-containing protein 64